MALTSQYLATLRLSRTPIRLKHKNVPRRPSIDGRRRVVSNDVTLAVDEGHLMTTNDLVPGDAVADTGREQHGGRPSDTGRASSRLWGNDLRPMRCHRNPSAEKLGRVRRRGLLRA